MPLNNSGLGILEEMFGSYVWICWNNPLYWNAISRFWNARSPAAMSPNKPGRYDQQLVKMPTVKAAVFIVHFMSLHVPTQCHFCSIFVFHESQI